jgi:polar amino acid transport system substrate-binding protein
MELAINIARKKGNVVVVGSIGMNIPRSPFYEKELNITISCSYGPGRYDPRYEIDGNDYPAAFVRWTENRNMQAILDLIASGKLDVKSLITHNFNIENAPSAYDIIAGKVKEDYLGIIINYPERENYYKKTIQLSSKSKQLSEVKVGFIGAGSFAQNYLLPPLKAAGAEMVGVTTATSVNALSVGKKYGFRMAGTDSIEIIRNPEVNAIFCASLHDSHSEYVVESIRQGKPVFVEKPLAVNVDQLEEIDNAIAEYNGRVMVGFNRRFSKPFVDIKNFYKARTEPMTISYRVNAGMPPVTFWVFRPEQGGGRIIGEACHFIDCMAYLTDAVPVKVYAECFSSSNPNTFNKDNVVISIKFSDGSVGSLQYFANGDSDLPKEYCEVHCEGSSAIMNNFDSVDFFRNGKDHKKYDGRKGHREEIFETISAMKTGGQMPIDYNTIRQVTIATFAALESLKTGYAIEINF